MSCTAVDEGVTGVVDRREPAGCEYSNDPAPASTRAGRRAAEVAQSQDGVISRVQLRELGISRHHIRNEVNAGRWALVGQHSVATAAGELSPRAQLHVALWEVGGDAALDGVAALQAAGLTGYETDVIEVSIPHEQRMRKHAGAKIRRRRRMPPVVAAGIRRVHPAVAVLHAAAGARTDRQAAYLIALAVQQRIVSTEHLALAWDRVTRTPRRALLEVIVQDVCDGAQSLGELDFAELCRRYGLPQPDRQVIRRTERGRIYLDVCWSGIGLVVEIDGGHHGLALNQIDDSLRQNEVTIGGETVLRIPLLGLRTRQREFMTQVLRAYLVLSAAAA